MPGSKSIKLQASDAGCVELQSLSPRSRILASARDLFYRHGLNAVGVEAIASQALTNKMTLYRHFKSKDDLIVAYVTEIADEGDAIWLKISNENPDPEKRLAAWLAFVEDILENKFQRGCALANAAVELPPEHAGRAIIEDYKNRKRERLVELFLALKYREPARLADEIFLMFEGARVSLQCGGNIPARRIMSMLRDMLNEAPRRDTAHKALRKAKM